MCKNWNTWVDQKMRKEVRMVVPLREMGDKNTGKKKLKRRVTVDNIHFRQG